MTFLKPICDLYWNAIYSVSTCLFSCKITLISWMAMSIKRYWQVGLTSLEEQAVLQRQAIFGRFARLILQLITSQRAPVFVYCCFSIVILRGVNWSKCNGGAPSKLVPAGKFVRHSQCHTGPWSQFQTHNASRTSGCNILQTRIFAAHRSSGQKSRQA